MQVYTHTVYSVVLFIDLKCVFSVLFYLYKRWFHLHKLKIYSAKIVFYKLILKCTNGKYCLYFKNKTFKYMTG